MYGADTDDDGRLRKPVFRIDALELVLSVLCVEDNKLEWLSVYMAPGLTVGFFQAYFPRDGSTRIKQFAVATGSAFGVMVLLTPPMVFTSGFRYVIPVIIAFMLYSGLILMKALLRRRQGAVVITLAFSAIFY